MVQRGRGGGLSLNRFADSVLRKYANKWEEAERLAALDELENSGARRGGGSQWLERSNAGGASYHTHPSASARLHERDGCN